MGSEMCIRDRRNGCCSRSQLDGRNGSRGRHLCRLRLECKLRSSFTHLIPQHEGGHAWNVLLGNDGSSSPTRCCSPRHPPPTSEGGNSQRQSAQGSSRYGCTLRMRSDCNGFSCKISLILKCDCSRRQFNGSRYAKVVKIFVRL